MSLDATSFWNELQVHLLNIQHGSQDSSKCGQREFKCHLEQQCIWTEGIQFHIFPNPSPIHSMPIHPPTHLSIHPTHLPIHLPIHPSTPSTHPFIHPFNLSIHSSIYPSTHCPSMHMSFHPSTHPSSHSSIYPGGIPKHRVVRRDP